MIMYTDPEHYECDNCSAEFDLGFDLDESFEPIVCPFCGADLEDAAES